MAMHNGNSSRARSPRGSIATSRRILPWLPVILALMVCGCGTMPIAAPLRANPSADRPVQKIDPSLLAECPPLPLASSGRSDALQRNHAQITGLYLDCRSRHSKLAQAVRERQQQETERLMQGPTSSSASTQH